MDIDIKISETLSEPVRQSLFGWSDDIFGLAGTELADLPGKSAELRFALYLDGQAMGHVGILRHTVAVAGQPIHIGGIGGVLTRPEAQGKGYAHQLLNEATAFLKNEWRVQFGMLFCFERLMSFYQSMGWQQIHNDVYLDYGDRKVLSSDVVMVLPLQSQAWPSGMVDVNDYAW
jgi:GNAT superfamily N-acetyltransferase